MRLSSVLSRKSFLLLLCYSLILRLVTAAKKEDEDFLTFPQPAADGDTGTTWQKLLPGEHWCERIYRVCADGKVIRVMCRQMIPICKTHMFFRGIVLNLYDRGFLPSNRNYQRYLFTIFCGFIMAVEIIAILYVSYYCDKKWEEWGELGNARARRRNERDQRATQERGTDTTRSSIRRQQQNENNSNMNRTRSTLNRTSEDPKTEYILQLPAISSNADKYEIINAIEAYYERVAGNCNVTREHRRKSQEEYQKNDFTRQQRTCSQCTCCSICLNDFSRGERVCLLPRCGHTFHPGCITKWLSQGKGARCPLCQTVVVD